MPSPTNSSAGILLRWFPWNVLLHQYNSIWWYPEYRAVQFGAETTGLAPDFRPTEGFAAVDYGYRAGKFGLLELLDAQRTRYAAQQGLVGARLAEQANRIALYSAVGGGWQAEPTPDVP